MSNNEIIKVDGETLFERVVGILEQARSNVVKAVNNNMVIAYWLIGHEIVEEIQSGEKRAEYGKQVIEKLSRKLTERYGRGFSTTNVRYFRNFYTVYFKRSPEIRHIQCGESANEAKRHTQSGILYEMSLIVCCQKKRLLNITGKNL